MSKIYLIIAREYREKVTNKSFVITTLMVPLIMAMTLLMPALLSDSHVDQSFLSLSESESGQMIGLATAVIIYFSIFLFGIQTMRSVMEEKQSRVVEILAGSITPFLLIAGKIISIMLLSITQITLWLVLFRVGLYLMPGHSLAIEWYPFALETQLQLFIFIPLFYMGGFLLYCSLFAIVGALSTPNTETNIWMIPLALPILFSLYVVLTPGAFSESLVRIVAFFPLTSPIAMPSQIVLSVGWMPLLVSVLLLWISTVGVIWISSRVYQSALLLYHNSISWLDIKRWFNKKN